MKVRSVRVVMNPAAGFLKPVGKISDRAKRYRANRPEVRPELPKRCNYCGSRKNVGVNHVNGREADNDPSNLDWACKSCNSIIGAKLKARGLGKRIDQMNPRAPRRSATLKEYGDAIKVMRGVFDGDVAKAVATIRATPRAVRSEYTSRSWGTRRDIYGPSGRQSEIPF